jgi:hypothetical protein
MELSPEQFASLKRVLSEPAAKAAALVPVPAEQIEAVLGKLETLVRRHAGSLGGSRLLIKYAPGLTGGRVLTDRVVSELIAAQTQIATIGDDGTLLAAASGTISLPAAVTESQDGPCLCLLCSAGQIGVFAAGKVVAEICTAPPPIQGRADWQRSWRELRESFDDHFHHCIESEKALRYWFDRKKRILLAGPDGTEKLFHHNLFWWCNNFIRDALDVYGETRSMGQDKTDITIVTEIGNIVIEVKWLGQNESKTRYTQVRIQEGMIQVADYLNRNGRLMKGYLVIYDGRSDEAHEKECAYPATCRHAKCEEPVVYFLRSETPSELASRMAAENQP